MKQLVQLQTIYFKILLFRKTQIQNFDLVLYSILLRNIINLYMITKLFRRFRAQRYNFSSSIRSNPQQEPTYDLSNQFLEDYKLGLINQKEKKFLISNQYMKRALQQLESQGLKSSESYITVLKKMIQNLQILRQHQDVNTLLQQVIKLRIQRQSNDSVLYSQYDTLFLHYLHTDIKQAILLGKSLLSDKRQTLPLNYKKTFTFYLGTAYLLYGNYGDSKRRLHECLKLDPTNNILKGMVLNNLALACWWHKHPYAIRLQDLKSSQEEEEKFKAEPYPDQKINSQFSDCKNLFKSAIIELQDIKKITDKQKAMNIQKLLEITQLTKADIAKYGQKDKLQFNNKQTAATLMNIAELIFCTKPELKDEAIFWFKLALYHSAQVDPLRHNRCLVMLAYLCAMDRDIDRADKLFKHVLQKEKDSYSYNRSTAMFRYGAILKQTGKRQQGDRWIKASIQYSKALPYWYKRMIHVLLPEMSL